MTVTRPTPADEELMVAYREGDEQAFALLFERYKTRLFNYFFRHLGIRALADDLLQSTRTDWAGFSAEKSISFQPGARCLTSRFSAI